MKDPQLKISQRSTRKKACKVSSDGKKMVARKKRKTRKYTRL